MQPCSHSRNPEQKPKFTAQQPWGVRPIGVQETDSAEGGRFDTMQRHGEGSWVGRTASLGRWRQFHGWWWVAESWLPCLSWLRPTSHAGLGHPEELPAPWDAHEGRGAQPRLTHPTVLPGHCPDLSRGALASAPGNVPLLISCKLSVKEKEVLRDLPENPPPKRRRALAMRNPSGWTEWREETVNHIGLAELGFLPRSG